MTSTILTGLLAIVIFFLLPYVLRFMVPLIVIALVLGLIIVFGGILAPLFPYVGGVLFLCAICARLGKGGDD